MTGIYRVRKGWFGKSVLQELVNGPSFIGGHVDASVRDCVWYDVDYRRAPRALVSQMSDEIIDKFTDGIRRKR